MKILIVEDALRFSNMVAESFRKLGHEVLQAKSLNEAGALFRDHDDIDIAFWDNSLPDGKARDHPDLLFKVPAVSISSECFGDRRYLGEPGPNISGMVHFLEKI